jgi:hypothetical protein
LQLFRKRPEQRATGCACRVARLIFLITALVGNATRSRRRAVARTRSHVHCCLLSRPRVLHILEHLFDVRAERGLPPAYPEVHFRLLSIPV